MVLSSQTQDVLLADWVDIVFCISTIHAFAVQIPVFLVLVNNIWIFFNGCACIFLPYQPSMVEYWTQISFKSKSKYWLIQKKKCCCIWQPHIELRRQYKECKTWYRETVTIEIVINSYSCECGCVKLFSWCGCTFTFVYLFLNSILVHFGCSCDIYYRRVDCIPLCGAIFHSNFYPILFIW